MNLLIAPWGAPWKDPCRPDGDLRWDEVTYVLGNEQVKSRTTLPLLLKTFRPEATLILVCDTVACYSDLQGEVSYPSMVKAVKRKYEDFIDTVLKDAGLTEFKGRVKVSVIPCLGKFINGEFRTRIADTRSWMLYELLNFLLTNLKENEEEAIAILDLTHGINYLPTLTYTSLKMLLHHLAFGRKFTLRVYNSDPFSKDTTKALHVNLIEESIIAPLTEPYDLSNKGIKLGFQACVRGLEESSDDLHRKVRELSKKFKEGTKGNHTHQLMYLYASIRAGASLATLTFMENLNPRELLDIVRRLFEIHRSEGFHVEILNVPSGKRRVKVTEVVCLTPSTEFIIKAIALAKSLSQAKAVEMKAPNMGHALEELRRITKIIAWNETLKLMIEDELYQTKKIICKYIVKNITGSEEISDEQVRKCIEVLRRLEEGVSLAEITAEVGKRVNEKFDERNFLAHAGLEYNVVEVKAIVNLAYRDKHMKDVKGVLKKVLMLSGSRH